MTGIRWAALLLAAALCMTLAGCGGGGAGAGESEEPEQPQENANELQERYADLEREVDVGARAMEVRLTEIRAPDDDGPAEQLSYRLGPKNPRATEDDLFDDACSDRGVSCEVLDLEELLAADREDFAAEDEYNPNNCSLVTDRSYYQGYVLADTEDGANYLKVRGDIADAAEGMDGDAKNLVEKAQRMEEAAAAYEEASGFGTAPNRSLREVEELAAYARTMGTEAEEALTDADERWAGYEARSEEVRAEALALHTEQGC